MPESSLDLNSELLIQVRSPSLNETLDVTIKLNETISCLKKSIQLVHPHHPSVDNQRIIYSGKLLQDEETIYSVIRTYDVEIVPTFHLVVKPSLNSFQPPPPQPQQQQQQPTPTIPQPSSIHVEQPAQPTDPLRSNRFAVFEDNNINVPAYPPVLPGGYQVVAINGQYYLAPVLVPSQHVPLFDTQQHTPPIFHPGQNQQAPNTQPFINNNAQNFMNGNAQPFANGNVQQPFNQAPNHVPAPAVARPAINAQLATSIWLALKLAIVLFMLCQGASIERIIIFHTIALVFFLYQTGRLRFVLRRVRAEDFNNRFRFAVPRAPTPQAQQQQNNDRAEGASTGVNNNNADNLTQRRQNNEQRSSSSTEQPTIRRPPTYLDTFKRGVYTFMASLWPTYNQDPRIAQAFENNNDQRDGLEEF